jgi:hypothetical protein
VFPRHTSACSPAMLITEAPDGLAARFDFVLDMR